MLTRQELSNSPLFQDIRYEEYLRMLDCFHAVQKSFRPDEVIYDFSDPASNAVGVVERGEASLIRIDEDGVATVLEELGPGGVFGRSLAFSGSGRDSLEVICRTACDVVFIDYPHILKRCERACTHHSLLVQNMLRLISDKAQASRSGWMCSPAGPFGRSCCATSTSWRRRPAAGPSSCPFP